jgi:NADPH:quinone reductase-like Zn-dependent oxidoreductase
MELRNPVVRLRRFGGPDELEVVDAPLPTAGPGEVRVRVLASSLNYTDVLIRRHLYPQTARRRPPFVLGYDALGRLAGLEPWGTAREEQASLIRELGATPIDYQREDFTRALPRGFDVVFDGIGEDGYRRSFAALKRGGLLCAIGYSAGVRAQHSMLSILMWIARLYLWRCLPGGKRGRFYSINVMRARHPAWFKEDLERLFGLLANGAIRPRVAERISFDEVAEAHRRLEAGGLEGKLVLCPDLTSRRNRAP